MRSSWGSVTKVRDGVYRLRYWATVGGVYMRTSETVRGTRKAAYDLLARRRVEHTTDAPCPTVGEVWERWYLPEREAAVCRGDLAPASLMQYRSMWRRHIEPTWSGVRADEVHPLAVQQWVDGLAISAARASMPVFRCVMDYAVRYELTDSNPLAIRYSMPSPSTSATMDDGTWGLDELCAISDAICGQWFEAAFILGAFGGCRVGESLGIRSEDVRLVDVRGVPVAVCDLRRQVTHGNELTDTLKNRWSYRAVVVPGSRGERLCGLASHADGGWLTSDGCGSHASQHRLRESWRSWWTDDLPERHDIRRLRPSWQTYMRWTLRVPPYLIERMMGHVGDGVTGVHYDRPEPEQFADAVARAYESHPF
jgi:hypothetical protein